MVMGKIPRLNEEGKIPEEFLPEGSGGGEDKEYIDSGDAKSVNDANEYTNSRMEEILMSDIFKQYIDGGDEKTLSDAKTYTDEQLQAFEGGGSGNADEALRLAKEYTDENISNISFPPEVVAQTVGAVFSFGEEEPVDTERYGVPVIWMRENTVSVPTIPVTPLEPTVTLSMGKIILPTVAGLLYKVNGEALAGTVTVPVPSVADVSAVATAGYHIPSGVVKSWTYSFEQAASSVIFNETFDASDNTKLAGRTIPGTSLQWTAPLGSLSPYDDTNGLEIINNRVTSRYTNNGSHNKVDVGVPNFKVTFNYKIPTSGASQVAVGVRSNPSTGGSSGITFRIRLAGGAPSPSLITVVDGTESEVRPTTPVLPFEGEATIEVQSGTVRFTLGSFVATRNYNANLTSSILRIFNYSSNSVGSNEAYIDNMKVESL